MFSLEEAYADGIHKSNSTAECLNRCLSAPVPSAARAERISAMRKQQAALTKQLQDQYAAVVPTTPVEVAELNREINAVQELIRAHNIHHEANVRGQDSVARQLKRARTLATTEEGANELNKLVAEQNDLETKLTSISKHLELAQLRQAELFARRDDAQRLFVKQAEDSRQNPAPPEILETVRQISQLLDDAGAFEKEVRAGAGEAISRVIRESLAAQATAFREAETFHRAWAKWMLFGIVGAILLSGGVIWFAFLRAGYDLPNIAAQAPSNAIQTIESVALISAGRLALLAFLAWTIRYCARLQNIHAEQAVIYRDRLAALGIAESILSATPDVDQKSATLRTLAEGYLNFEQSAFRVRQSPRENRTLRSELRQLKNIADAVKPILDGVGSIAEKLVRKP